MGVVPDSAQGLLSQPDIDAAESRRLAKREATKSDLCQNCPHPKHMHFSFNCDGAMTKPGPQECPCDGFVAKAREALAAIGEV
jgi:hypothetical protein